MEHTPDSQPPAAAEPAAEASPYAELAAKLRDQFTLTVPVDAPAEPTAEEQQALDAAMTRAWIGDPEPAAKPGHGGAREGSGRKAKRKPKQVAPAYVHLTAKEKRDLEAKAKKAKLSVSAYIAKRLGFQRTS